MSAEKPLSTQDHKPKPPASKWFLLEEMLFFAIIILSIVGVGITDYAPAASWAYWVFMVAALCACAVLIEKTLLPDNALSFPRVLTTQLLHWGATLVAILLSFSFVQTGRMTYEGSGLVILLILSLSTFLDGHHVGWRFYLAGIFLGLSAVLVAYVEEFMWILLVIAGVSVAASIFLEKHFSAKTRQRQQH
jgi:hypothetical protein